MWSRDEAALIGLFTIHNVEEILHLPRDQKELEKFFSRELPTRLTYGLATAILTGGAFVALSLGGQLRSTRAGEALTLATSSMLAGNAVTHCVRSIISGRYNGGLLSSPALLWLGYRVFRSARSQFTGPHRRLIFVLSNASAPILIIASLAAARRLSQLKGTTE